MQSFFQTSFSKDRTSETCGCHLIKSKKEKIKIEYFQGNMKYCSIDKRSNEIFISKYTVFY